MIDAALDIKLLAPEEWHVLRTTRLRALRDSPQAFASSLEVEVSWGEAQWRRLSPPRRGSWPSRQAWSSALRALSIGTTVGTSSRSGSRRPTASAACSALSSAPSSIASARTTHTISCCGWSKTTTTPIGPTAGSASSRPVSVSAYAGERYELRLRLQVGTEPIKVGWSEPSTCASPNCAIRQGSCSNQPMDSRMLPT